MPVDTGIYANLLRPPPSMADIDHENIIGQQDQLNLKSGQQKADEYTRGLQQDADQRSAVSQFGTDQTANYNRLLQTGNLKSATDYQKSIADAAKAKAEADSRVATTAKTEADTAGVLNEQKLAKHNQRLQELAGVNTLEDAHQWILDGVKSGDLPFDKASVIYANLQKDPSTLPTWKQQAQLGGTKLQDQFTLQKPIIATRNTGGTTDTTSVNPLTGEFKVLNTTTNTPSPDAVVTDRRVRASNAADSSGGIAGALKGDLSGDQRSALNLAIKEGRIDPNRINSRTAPILANALIDNPGVDLAKSSADISLSRNAGFRQKAMTAEVLPEIMQNMVDSGKKLNFSPVKVIGAMQAWRNGQLNDPAMTEYMVQRNDALMTVAGVMRGSGMTDMAHKAETEVSSPTMSPDALDAWLKGQMKSLEPRLKLNRQITRNGPAPSAIAAPGSRPSLASFESN